MRVNKDNERKIYANPINYTAHIALASAPAWPYSRGWGYYPSGGLGTILLILLLLWLLGVI